MWCSRCGQNPVSVSSLPFAIFPGSSSHETGHAHVWRAEYMYKPRKVHSYSQISTSSDRSSVCCLQCRRFCAWISIRNYSDCGVSKRSVRKDARALLRQGGCTCTAAVGRMHVHCCGKEDARALLRRGGCTCTAEVAWAILHNTLCSQLQGSCTQDVERHYMWK